ncbi:redoxin domain-containing protein [Mucilaginibacter roseus]|uniref:Redoxin domain-containing protein n=1 Tax=Mucilaginibacter roseus TaxID=1528868 RepID=A0ABS8U1E9_9SPHI|nr:redoxin domain-containing protein [Mucilaginibacter roseus]MCD8739739.1 redoxin domain-containing protein [Mucilaginibacter roseus]
MRKLLAVVWLCLLFGIVGCLFWYNEYQYTLPTPVPVDYKNVPVGGFINLTNGLTASDNKPLLLHFFNPKCPCSRFNIQHFKQLVKTYQNRVNFVVVLLDDQNDIKEVRDKFDLNVPIVISPGLAKACGVYSTPQAAVIDTRSRLYYRGNYNTNRYCTNKETEYARIALDGVLQKSNPIHFNALALTAYGCSLPNCER